MEGSLVPMILNDMGKLILGLWKESIPLFPFGVGMCGNMIPCTSNFLSFNSRTLLPFFRFVGGSFV